MAGGSKRVINVALADNSAIAVTDFAAAGSTGSSAMLPKAVHSPVETGNQRLLLFGSVYSKKPHDEPHSFGHGIEV